MKARDVMTPRVISIEADAAITQAVHLLLQNRISGLPVIDREGELVDGRFHSARRNRHPAPPQLLAGVSDRPRPARR